MVMPDMKKGLPYTFKTYKVAQSKSKQLKMPFTDPVFTHIKQKENGCLTSSYPRMWTSPSLSHPSICNWRWEKSLCFHDLYSRCHFARMIFCRCQNMSASSPTTVLARRPKRDNLLTANHFKWSSQYYCHKTQNLNQIMPISTEECNCLSSALFQLLSELSSYIDTRF